MVECCSVNPGHLGSSLGAVELIVALHYIYNTPEDKIVFDVGHQAYAHKILTGRRELFRKNRMRGGISGFPKMDESPYDAYKSVAVIGDGAMTGGLAWEGLNNAGSSMADILVILNDNDISIDRNLGGLHDYLLRVTTSQTYNRVKRGIWNRLGEGKLRDWIQKRVIDTKANLVRSSGGALFEALGFRYFGPIDGNDIGQMVSVLSRIKDLRGPRILHLHTRKGAGYAPAEEDPTTWHAPGKFDAATGTRIKTVNAPDRYQDVFGKVLVELAGKDTRVVGITPAMASGCGMNRLQDAFPDRFFDVGIEEGHAVTFSAGLAAAGLRPFCNIYSSFSQRAYDNIIHDVALQNLPVCICLDRAGLVGEDGATHTGAFDLSAFRCIPSVVISAPRNEMELRNLMYTALEYPGGPFFIRYPRGYGEGMDWEKADAHPLPVGKGECLMKGKGVAVLALGPVANRALEAAQRHKSDYWVGPSVYDMRFLKPLDQDILEEVSSYKAILTVEDGSLKGGLYGAVSEYFAARPDAPIIKGVGIPDRFVVQDTQKAQREECGLDTESIFDLLREMMKNV